MLDDDLLEHAYNGKKRIYGIQAPVKWVSPRVDFAGGDIGATFLAGCEKAGCGCSERPFILPEFAPQLDSTGVQPKLALTSPWSRHKRCDYLVST